MLRRFRGLVSTAILWGAIAVPVEVVMLTVAAIAGAELPSARMFTALLTGAVVHSAFNGLVFASLVTVGARRRSLAALRLREFLAWGAVAGLASRTLGVVEAWRLGHLGVLPDRVAAGLAVAGAIGATTGAVYYFLTRERPRIRKGSKAQPLLDSAPTVLAHDAGGSRTPTRARAT